MPFAILLEAALQPCGWLAAYVGSALTSEVNLSFRNLGGSAVQRAAVTPDIGTLTTEVTLTKVSRSGGMIIQNYDFSVPRRGPAHLLRRHLFRLLQQGLRSPTRSASATPRPMSPPPRRAPRRASGGYPDRPPLPRRAGCG